VCTVGDRPSLGPSTLFPLHALSPPLYIYPVTVARSPTRRSPRHRRLVVKYKDSNAIAKTVQLQLQSVYPQVPFARLVCPPPTTIAARQQRRRRDARGGDKRPQWLNERLLSAPAARKEQSLTSSERETECGNYVQSCFTRALAKFDMRVS
jgi:hypothetical protein